MITAIICFVIAFAIWFIGRHTTISPAGRQICDVVAVLFVIAGVVFFILWIAAYGSVHDYGMATTMMGV